MKSNLYIFLDIDGVLTTTSEQYSDPTTWNLQHQTCPFNKNNVNIFNDIIDIYSNNFNIFVVISSDWKYRHTINDLNEIFKWNGINTPIYDITPSLWKINYKRLDELEECRSAEILKYINEYNIKNYIAIDDLDLSPWINDEFILITKFNEGLSENNIKNKIINLIKKYEK